ncbi:MAG: hypothetical protein AAGE90_11025 [Pseudomonadota bacterium]
MIGNPRQPASGGQTTVAGSGNPPLALWFRPEAVVLMRRDPAGAWAEQVEVALDAEGNAVGPKALLDRARLVGPDPSGPPAVALWLPEEHVIRLNLELPENADPATRLEAAITAVAAQTGQPSTELALSIGAAEPGSRTRQVIGAFAQTAREAQNYAAAWGFHAEVVTAAPGIDGSYAPSGRLRSLLDVPTLRARVAATVIPAAPASLAADRAVAAPRPRRKAPGAIAICAALGAVGVMAFMLGVEFGKRPQAPSVALQAEIEPPARKEAAPQAPPLLASTPPIEVGAPAPMRAPKVEDALTLDFHGLPVALTIGPTVPERAAAPDAVSPPAEPLPAPAPAPRIEEGTVDVAAKESAPEVEPSEPTVPLAEADATEAKETELAPSSAESARADAPSQDPGPASNPVTLAEGSTPVAKAVLGDPRGAGQVPALEPATEGAQTRQALLVLGSPKAAIRVALPTTPGLTATISAKHRSDLARDAQGPPPDALGRPLQTLDEDERTVLGGALIAAIDALDLALPEDLRPPEPVDTTGEEADGPPSGLAPESLEYMPPSRPSDDAVAAVPSASGEAVPLPPEQPALAPDETDSAETEEAIDEAPSALAVAVAPRPKLRPSDVPPVQRGNVVRLGAGSESAGPRVARVKPPEARQPLDGLPLRLPSRVGRSGGDGRLALDDMALIGVLDLDTGRKALLRLPNGRYRRLGIGDEVEGWRVMAITGESMRIGREGAERVLALVAR